MNLIGPVRIISTRQKLLKSSVKSLDLTLDGNRISKTESERVLGVYMYSRLLGPFISIYYVASC